MSAAKKRTLQAIGELPDDADPQEIIKSLDRVYRLRSELLKLQGSGEDLDKELPSDLQLLDGLLLYTGPLGGMPEEAVAAAREERTTEILG